jgi:hypothetical protein
MVETNIAPCVAIPVIICTEPGHRQLDQAVAEPGDERVQHRAAGLHAELAGAPRGDHVERGHDRRGEEPPTHRILVTGEEGTQHRHEHEESNALQHRVHDDEGELDDDETARLGRAVVQHPADHDAAPSGRERA